MFQGDQKTRHTDLLIFMALFRFALIRVNPRLISN